MTPRAGALLALVLAVAIAACSSTSSGSPVTEDEARAMAEHMLAAYNDGDYQAWSRDWSEAMKDAIGEEAFLAFRDQTLAAGGEFRSIEAVEMRPGNNPGVTRWEFVTEFANGQYDFMIAFNEGSKLIDGVNLAPTP